jgi:hypothetical protein
MPIDQELLAILACPACKGDLLLAGGQDGLICEKCMLKYEIKDDIPIMLIDEAQKLTPEELRAEKKKSVEMK